MNLVTVGIDTFTQSQQEKQLQYARSLKKQILQRECVSNRFVTDSSTIHSGCDLPEDVEFLGEMIGERVVGAEK